MGRIDVHRAHVTGKHGECVRNLTGRYLHDLAGGDPWIISIFLLARYPEVLLTSRKLSAPRTQTIALDWKPPRRLQIWWFAQNVSNFLLQVRPSSQVMSG